MVPFWLLIVESIVLGLVLGLALPVWALFPVLFGVTEDTPPGPARRVYALLVLFPLVAIGSMTAAFLTGEAELIRWLFVVLPVLHIVVLYLARVRQ
jgi:hypothetical protein